MVPEGQFLAWISDDDGNPSNQFYRWILPYTLVDGTPVADNYRALV